MFHHYDVFSSWSFLCLRAQRLPETKGLPRNTGMPSNTKRRHGCESGDDPGSCVEGRWEADWAKQPVAAKSITAVKND